MSKGIREISIDWYRNRLERIENIKQTLTTLLPLIFVCFIYSIWRLTWFFMFSYSLDPIFYFCLISVPYLIILDILTYKYKKIQKELQKLLWGEY